jgi:hypothetical protein
VWLLGYEGPAHTYQHAASPKTGDIKREAFGWPRLSLASEPKGKRYLISTPIQSRPPPTYVKGTASRACSPNSLPLLTLVA